MSTLVRFLIFMFGLLFVAAQLYLTLYSPTNCSLPGSSVHGIILARMLKWIAIYFFRGSSQPRDRTHISCLADRFSTIWKALTFGCCSVTKLCLTLWDSMDCSTPGLPVPHHLLKFAQVHIHWISDAIQPSHPLPLSSPFAFNLSQHQGLSNELHLQYQFFQWVVMIDFP